MFLPEAELLVEGVFISGFEVYDDSRWRPWLTKINDSEEDSSEAVGIAERVEEEIKILQAHLSRLTSTSFPSPSSTLPSPSSPTPGAFQTELMDIDFDLTTDSSRATIPYTDGSQNLSQNLAASAASSSSDVPKITSDSMDDSQGSQNLAVSTASSSSNPTKVKLSLKDYLARKKQREAEMIVEQPEFPASGKFSLFRLLIDS